MKYYSNNRNYRNCLKTQDLANFTVRLGESDLFICAERPLYSPARESLGYIRLLIQDYIQKHPHFATSLKPYVIKDEAPEIIHQMAEASVCAKVGPMAAVAGAVAEYVGRDLLRQSSEVIVENGGDIFMKTERVRRIGIFAGESPLSGRFTLEIKPKSKQGYWGVCASSGTVGPSLSFGQADAAVVVCNSAILADAWATRLGNMVKSAGDLERAVRFIKDQPGVKGIVIIIGEKMGVWGDIKLVDRKGVRDV